VLDSNPYGIGTDTIIYDKPLIYYLLSYILLLEIKEITVVETKLDKDFLEKRFAGGNE